MQRPNSIGFAAAIAVAAGLAASVTATPAAARTQTNPQAPPSWALCAGAVKAQEARHKIPDRLLTAVSLVESGRWNPRAQRSMAWPWTIHARGKGQFFPTKRAAVAAVRALQRRGVRNIDVGCMQVNLHYHPKAFRSLEAAFDPAHNAAYAAKFLTALKREHKSWRRAVQHYHSATVDRRIPYQERVFAIWKDPAATDAKRATRRNKARLQGVARTVNQAHRAKRNAHRTGRTAVRRAANTQRSATGKTRRLPLRSSSPWPPRNVKAQRRAQNLARARALTPTPVTKNR